MFAYELYKIRSAELIREADNHRLARAARRRRQESDAARQARSHSSGRGRTGFARAA